MNFFRVGFTRSLIKASPSTQGSSGVADATLKFLEGRVLVAGWVVSYNLCIVGTDNPEPPLLIG